MKCPNCGIDCKLTVGFGNMGEVYQCGHCLFTSPVKNKLVIQEIFAFVMLDDDGNEGIPAINHGGMTHPLMGADMARVESLRPHAKIFADALKKKIKLLKFSKREMLEEIE